MGAYDSIDNGARFQVKRITVKPGATLSLQMHHRAEHWIVVSGTAEVTRGDEVILLSENQSTYIPLGVTHRLKNPGKLPLELIEVQSGSYLGEDDIVRFEDSYGRAWSPSRVTHEKGREHDSRPFLSRLATISCRRTDRAYTLSETSSSESAIRLLMITSASCLNACRSLTTRELKNSAASRTGSWTITSTPLALMRFMIPWMLEERKLSEPAFMIKR